MDKQLIISVGREFGSGGHVIAEALAQRFSLPLYDNNLLDHIAEEMNVSRDTLAKYDEKPKNIIFSRTIRGYSNSPQENVAHIQFNFLKKMADEGKSFVVVGRCSETILKGCPGLISIFVLGDRDVKKDRVKEIYHLSCEEARRKMETEDVRRKMYHNYYCKGKWGDSRNYDLSVNSSKLGIDATVDLLEHYINQRAAQMQ